MKEMPLIDHLEELRTTIIRVAVIILVTFALAYGFGEYIAEVLLLPLRDALGGRAQGQIVYLGLLDKVIAQLQLAFWSSAILSSPVWFFEIWRFVRPALHDYEAKMVRPFLMVGFLLFLLGGAFAYFVVFPNF